MTTIKTKVGDHPKHTKNPFMEELVSRMSVRTVTSRGKDAKVSKYIPYGTTEHEEYVRITDRDRFVKLYATDITKMFSLTKTAQTILGEIMMQIAEDKNDGERINLPPASWWKTNKNLSPSAYWIAIADLLQKNFIARTEGENLYYFNPLMVFNGNRASFIKTYVLDEIENKKDKEAEDYHLEHYEDAA